MNEKKRNFRKAIDTICSATKRHPDYHICVRCEGLEMRKGFTTDVWWHLLQSFSVGVRKKFWTGYHRGEDGRPPASFPILGAIGTDEGNGTHAHLLVWRDVNKRQMDSNDEMRKRCKQAFAHAVRKQQLPADAPEPRALAHASAGTMPVDLYGIISADRPPYIYIQTISILKSHVL